MPINIESLSTATLTANTLSNLILVTPQKDIGIKPTQQGNQSINVPSILFHVKGTEQVDLSSGITDHFIEDNTAINDHISLNPEMVTAQGYIGELNNVTPELLQALKLAAEKLTIVGAYVPALSVTALRALAIAEQIYRVGEIAKAAGIDRWNSISNSKFNEGGNRGKLNEIGSNGLVTDNGNQTKQQKAFQQFYGYRQNRTLFKVQTPWAIFQNMAIENLIAIQDEETDMITDFKIQFKMLRFAETSLDYNRYLTSQGRFGDQSSQEAQLGVGNTTPSKPIMSILPTG